MSALWRVTPLQTMRGNHWLHCSGCRAGLHWASRSLFTFVLEQKCPWSKNYISSSPELSWTLFKGGLCATHFPKASWVVSTYRRHFKLGCLRFPTAGFVWTQAFSSFGLIPKTTIARLYSFSLRHSFCKIPLSCLVFQSVGAILYSHWQWVRVLVLASPSPASFGLSVFIAKNLERRDKPFVEFISCGASRQGDTFIWH